MANNEIEFYIIPKDEAIAKKLVKVLVIDHESDDYFLVGKERVEEFYRLCEDFYKKKPFTRFLRTCSPDWAEYVGYLSNLEIIGYGVKDQY